MKTINNMKIGTKIFAGFGILIISYTIVGILAIWNMNQVRKEATQLADQYIAEVNVANNLERASLLTMYNMRGYALSEEEHYFEKGIKHLKEIKTYMEQAQKMAKTFSNLIALKDGASKIEEKINKYEELVNKTKASIDIMHQSRHQIDAITELYQKNCYDYLNEQNSLVKKEVDSGAVEAEKLSERYHKVFLINDVIDLGNEIRVATYKSLDLREPELIQKALNNFDSIEKKLDEIKVYTHNEINIRRIEEIRTSGINYKKAMTDIYNNWNSLQNLSKDRGEAAEQILQIANEVSNAGMKRMLSVADEAKSLLTRISTVMAVVLPIVLFVGSIIVWFISRTIRTSIAKIVNFTNQFGSGDLRNEIAIDTKDEIGEMAGDLNNSVRNLKTMMQELADTTHSLSGSSEELSSVSDQMASSAEEMNSQANMVAAASEQVAASVGTVASASEQLSATVTSIASMTEEMSSTFIAVADLARKTSVNVNEVAISNENISGQINSVASAVEEMTASLNEVAKNTAQGNRISQDARQRTDQINIRMNALSSASKKIGKIVSVIKDIADQTNMLALNAAIEAAGAGEAGKGFAVVAGEVKELARQSAEASDEIAGQIEEIQKSSNDAVSAIEDINKIINEIARINEMTAASVEEQSATATEISKSVANTAAAVKTVSKNTNESAKLVGDIAKSTDETSKAAREIAGNIEQLVIGVKEAARSSDEAARGVNEISKNIMGINTASKQTAIGAGQTSQSSKELAKMASGLTQIVGRFKL